MDLKIGHRIKNARLLGGLSQQNAADMAGVSKQMISKYERDMSLPSSDVLIHLAKAYKVPIDYFFNRQDVTIGNISFRKKSHFSKRKEGQIKELIRKNVEDYLFIENELGINTRFENPIVQETINDFNDIQQAARKLRNAWMIGMDPIHNVIQLLEDKAVKVIELADTDSSFDGLATLVENCYPVLVINKNFGLERKRFTIAHELGHLLLPLDRAEKKEELYCNQFASELLYPADQLLSEFGRQRKHISIEELVSAQDKYGISIPAIIYKFQEHGIISQRLFKNFYIRYRSDKKFRKFIDKSRFPTPELSQRFEQLVYRAFSENIISTSKAAQLLGKPLSELKEVSTI